MQELASGDIYYLLVDLIFFHQLLSNRTTMSKFKSNEWPEKKKYPGIQKLFLRFSFEATASGNWKVATDSTDSRNRTSNSKQLF